MNNVRSQILLIVALVNPFLLQAMEKKKQGKLKIPAVFAATKTSACLQAAAKPILEVPAQYQEECKMLMDAYTHKKKSKYYDPQYKSPYFIGDKLVLEAALKNKDTQACVQLFANGTLDYTANQDLLYDALRNGYYPLCHLLLTTGQANAQFEEMQRKTPLYWVLDHGNTLPPADLLALCTLLRQHGADIHKPLQDGRYTFESLAAQPKLTSFYPIFPILMQLGVTPTLQDDQGFTPIHRLARCKDASTSSLINLIIPYQAYLEREIARTVLLIHRFSASHLSRVPKDIILVHIMRYFCPFRHKLIHEMVNQQLALLLKLLTIRTKLLHTPQDILKNVPQTTPPYINSDILDPQKIEQHRAAFTEASRELMAALDAPRT